MHCSRQLIKWLLPSWATYFWVSLQISHVLTERGLRAGDQDLLSATPIQIWRNLLEVNSWMFKSWKALQPHSHSPQFAGISSLDLPVVIKWDISFRGKQEYSFVFQHPFNLASRIKILFGLMLIICCLILEWPGVLNYLFCVTRVLLRGLENSARHLRSKRPLIHFQHTKTFIPKNSVSLQIQSYPCKYNHMHNAENESIFCPLEKPVW